MMQVIIDFFKVLCSIAIVLDEQFSAPNPWFNHNVSFGLAANDICGKGWLIGANKKLWKTKIQL